MKTKKTNQMSVVGYAVARKGEWWNLTVYPEREMAERDVRGNEGYLEVREVYGFDGFHRKR